MATETFKYFKADTNLRSNYGGAAILNNGDSREITKETLCMRHICRQLGLPNKWTKFLFKQGSDGTDAWIRVKDNTYSAISSFLTSAELATVVSSAPVGFVLNSTQMTYQPDPEKSNIVVRGDSISFGVQTTTGDARDVVWTQAIESIEGALLNFGSGPVKSVGEGVSHTTINLALGSSTWANTNAGGGPATYPLVESLAYNQRTRTLPLYDDVFIYWLGTNDTNYDSSLVAADVWARAKTRIKALSQEFPKVKIVVATALRRSEADPLTSGTLNFKLNAYNNLMRSEYQLAGAHVLCDFDAVTEVSVLNGNTTNTTYYAADGVHLKTAGHTLIMPVAKAAIIAAKALTAILPINDVVPTISGTPTQGQTLTATQGTWHGYPTPVTANYTYQWRRNGTAISGATANTYLLTATDVGTTITVTETATTTAGATSATSAATASIAASSSDLKSIVSSTVFDLDFTDTNCYSGSGTNVLNLISAPADGSAQSDYDFILGDGINANRQPIFSGTAGDSAAEFIFTGATRYFSLDGLNTAFINSFNKSGAGSGDFWMIFFGNFANSPSSQYIFATLPNGGTNPGFSLFLNANEVIRAQQRGDTATAAWSPATAAPYIAPIGDYNWLGFSYSKSLGQLRWWNGSTTATEISFAYNAGVTNSPTKLLLGASNDLAGEFEDGTKAKAFCGGNSYLTNTQMADIVAEYQTRHGNIY